MKKVLIVGAGLTGSVLARQLAEAGVPCVVIDKQTFVGGLCHSCRDEETGVDMHVFGPHIFHTSDERVWAYVQRFDRFCPWVNRVKACNHRGVFSFPVNLHTINQLFGKQFTPAEACQFVQSLQDKRFPNPRNAEEKMLSLVGREIYETFFQGYTTKQWGVSPAEMPADVVMRIPVRFNYEDNYYNSKYQGFPVSGYTQWITNMLTHPLITVLLGVPYEHGMKEEYGHVFYAGPIDEYFLYAEGDLSYRTVEFKVMRGLGDMQGCGCMNFSDLSVPYTRSHQHNYFSPWEHHDRSVLMQEFSRASTRESPKFYPVRMKSDMEILRRYTRRAEAERTVSFIGRLGCYRYLDMRHCVLLMLEFAEKWLEWKKKGSAGKPPMLLEA